MAKMHIFKRTVVPRPQKERQSPNSEVKTYYLSAEELEYYRLLPKQEHPRIIIPGRYI
ncbi:hypothetical protein [Paenibacillus sambharensis]|uniref:hypothetical protein n=1 Tax=Paenibacillus sambharensis TaxID=1803190 RepID=UPI0015E8791B|nr:hypothetical protein [Paenibacillus sambharensis]